MLHWFDLSSRALEHGLSFTSMHSKYSVCEILQCIDSILNPINLVWWLAFIFRTHIIHADKHSQETQVRTHINNNTHDNELDTHSTNKHQSLLPRDETLKQYEWANMIHYTNTTLNSCFGFHFIRAAVRACMCVLLFFIL